jgi:hypothetical protein
LNLSPPCDEPGQLSSPRLDLVVLPTYRYDEGTVGCGTVGEVCLDRSVEKIHPIHFIVALCVRALDAAAYVGDLRTVWVEVGDYVADAAATVGEVLLALAVQGVHAIDLLVAFEVRALGAMALVKDLRPVWRESGGCVLDVETVVGEVPLARAIKGVDAINLNVAL